MLAFQACFFFMRMYSTLVPTGVYSGIYPGMTIITSFNTRVYISESMYPIHTINKCTLTAGTYQVRIKPEHFLFSFFFTRFWCTSPVYVPYTCIDLGNSGWVSSFFFFSCTPLPRRRHVENRHSMLFYRPRRRERGCTKTPTVFCFCSCFCVPPRPPFRVY